MAYTTATRVRQRLGLAAWEGDDTAIGQFITDAEGVLLAATGLTYIASDEDYALVCSICTNIAAEQLLVALINPPGSKPDPEKTMTYLKILPELRRIIDRDMGYLVKRERIQNKEIPLPRSTTA